jgi:hypothetical protein
MVEKLAAIDESQNEVELLWRLERELERYDERVVDLGEDRSFGERMRDFGSRDDVSFADGLKSVDSVRVLLPKIVNSCV